MVARPQKRNIIDKVLGDLLSIVWLLSVMEFLIFQLKYAEVELANYEAHKPNLIHAEVKYSLIDLRLCPEGI